MTRVLPCLRRFLSQIFLVPKKDGLQTSNQPETSEPTHGASLFQDGEPSNDERSVTTRRPDGFNGLERCLSVGDNLRGPPEIPAVPVVREHI